jgi:8-oxo-dGTP diphosphatase
MRSTYPAAVYLCLRDGGDILLLRRAGTGYRDGELAVPAGHIERGESATAALLRETREEILIELAPADVRMVLVQHGRADGETYIDFFFTAESGGAMPAIGEPGTCSELLWAPVERLPGDVVPAVRHGIEAIERGETYTEFGWEQ